jgi:superfamily I DNA and RNA helicase
LVSIRDGFESRADENKWIAGEISNLIRNKGLRAEDIMVVSLKGEMDEALNLFRDIRARDIDAYLETTSAKNLEDINANRDKFGDAGAVSVSRVARAKGNEANFVFVAHLDAVASDSESLKKMNLLLTAVTRSRGWLRFSGTGYYGFYDEVKETVSAINNSMEITFVFKRFPRWSFNTVSEEEEETGIVQTKLDEDL